MRWNSVFDPDGFVQRTILRASPEHTIPKHLPIKVKLKQDKEKSFKDMKNDKWVREFELEVKNTGDRPIYFLHLMLVLPETIVGGHPLMFPFYYGRNELSSFKNLAEKDDVPINPGETHTFTVHPGQVAAWEKSVKEKGRPQPAKVDLFFEILNFGDHTGFVGHDGEVFVPRSQRPDLGKCVDPSKENALRDVGWALTFPSKWMTTNFGFQLPTGEERTRTAIRSMGLGRYSTQSPLSSALIARPSPLGGKRLAGTTFPTSVPR